MSSFDIFFLAVVLGTFAAFMVVVAYCDVSQARWRQAKLAAAKPEAAHEHEYKLAA